MTEGHIDFHDLKREMGLLSATVLVVANMVGTGIFTTSGFIMEALEDPQAMLLCWFLGGVLALCGALCYGELGALFPKAGGEYVYLRETFGRLTAFVSGWVSLIVGFSAPIAAASIAFASYFFRSLPKTVVENPSASYLCTHAVSITPVTLLAIGVIIVLSLVHSHSLYFGSRVQNLLTIFKVGILLAFGAGGLWLGNGSTEHFTSDVHLGVVFSGPFATSLIFISFAYSGWNAAGYLGAEIRNPGRNIPLSLLSGTLLVMILYLLLNAVFIYALPMEEMKGVIEVGAKSALCLFGPQAGGLFSIALTICLLSVISAMIMAGPRIYFAMARDGVFFHQFGRVTRIHKTPALSIFLQAAIAIFMVVTSSFDKLLLYIGFTLSIFVTLAVLGMMLLRMKQRELRLPYRTFGYPITPIFFILMNLWIVIFAIRSNPSVSLYGGVTIAAGVLAYFYFARTAMRTGGKGLSKK